MKKFFCAVIMLVITTLSSYGQNNGNVPTDKILRKVAWNYEGGLGYQYFDPSALKGSLRANNYGSDLSSSLILFNYGLGAVFFDKLYTGLNFEAGSTSDFMRSGTSVSLSKFGAGLKLGYDIWANKSHKISLLYQLGIDVNELSLVDNVRALPDFGAALDQRTSHSLYSGNVSNRFLVRYDYLFKQKQDEKAVMTPALGIELGYSAAGNNSWDDVVNGPEINNSGMFANLVFSTRIKKYKMPKSKL
jgi:hypothetical protein